MIKLRTEDTCGNSRYSNGRIDPDSPWGKEFGFTSDKFDGWLWKERGWIIVSFIECKEPGCGHFKKLIRSIKDFCFDVAVPTPMPQMEAILKKWDWHPNYISDPTFGTVEIWSEKDKIFRG